ncbi:MAG: hypothetical protein BGO43_08565 [Gammaproteobacteria bacterium 39-13]|nr:squalene/phytoene synthase family protein [Gammaproteobacteria bacterium]OJV94300.1 MAG: hypothetical protein BGO43_08565 [Gammaproteobacteria bacterium 39-13]
MVSEHFQPKIIPRASTLHYALVFASPLQQKAARVLYTFCQQMKAILANVNEIEITKTKLLWWQQEIARLYANSPQHPLSHALLPLIETYQLPEQCFQDIVAGTLIDLEHPHFETNVQQLNYCQKIGGAQNSLFCQLFIQQDQNTLAFAKHCGIASQLIYFIFNFGAHIRQGKCYFSEEDLVACSLTHEQLFHEQDEKLCQLLAMQATRAREHYEKANQLLPEKNRYSLLGPLVFTNLSLALLDEIERDNFPVLTQQYKLTPLFKLWIAWRTKWREKQRAKRFSHYF